jgi:hypothetical protein
VPDLQIEAGESPVSVGCGAILAYNFSDATDGMGSAWRVIIHDGADDTGPALRDIRGGPLQSTDMSFSDVSMLAVESGGITIVVVSGTVAGDVSFQ